MVQRCVVERHIAGHLHHKIRVTNHAPDPRRSRTFSAYHSAVELLEGGHLVRRQQPAQVERARYVMLLRLVPWHVTGPLESADFRGWLRLVRRLAIEGEEVDHLRGGPG